jgi:hypothetical protein
VWLKWISSAVLVPLAQDRIWDQLDHHMDVHKIRTVTLKLHTSIAGAMLIMLPRITSKGHIEMNWIKSIYNRIVMEIRYRKKFKELRKRDPFIYK